VGEWAVDRIVGSRREWAIGRRMGGKWGSSR
jgi:hypothetical protein